MAPVTSSNTKHLKNVEVFFWNDEAVVQLHLMFNDFFLAKQR